MEVPFANSLPMDEQAMVGSLSLGSITWDNDTVNLTITMRWCKMYRKSTRFIARYIEPVRSVYPFFPLATLNHTIKHFDINNFVNIKNTDRLLDQFHRMKHYQFLSIHKIIFTVVRELASIAKTDSNISPNNGAVLNI